MIAEYIEEYCHGVVLTPNQQCFITDRGQTLPLVQLLVPCSVTLNIVQRYADELAKSHISLASNYQEIPGFKGLRSLPNNRAKVVVDALHYSQDGVLNLAQLTLLSPVELAPQEGCNLQLTFIQTSEQNYLVLRGFAGSVDLPSLEIIAAMINGQLKDEEALQFPDYVTWQQEMLKEDDGLAGQAFWQNYLTGDIPLPLQLPYNMGTVNESERSYIQAHHVINANLWQDISCYATRLGMSNQSMTHYAWWWLMARLATTPRFLTALHYDPRQEDEAFEGAVGCYAKALPLMIEYQPEQPLENWLLALHTQCEKHRQFAQSISKAQLKVAFTATDFTCPQIEFQLDWHTGQNYDLNIAISSNGALTLNYCQNNYSADAVMSLLAQLEQVLSIICIGEAQHKSEDISILNETHKARLLAIKGKKLTHPVESIMQRVHNLSQSRVNKTALTDGNIEVSYAALWLQVEQVAKGLITKQPKTVQPILLLLPRDADLIIAMLASIRAGFGFVPLDPSWPQVRIDKVFAQFDNPVVVAASADQGHTLGSLKIFSEMALPTLESIENSLAYTIFTSGSTGTPKGVYVGQQQLSAYCYASSESLNLAAQKNFALTATVAADLGYTCLFNALYLGKKLCIANEKQSMESAAFSAFLLQHQIDCIKIVPSHLQALCDLKSLPYFPQKIILGGEACPNTFLRSLQQWAPDSEIYNHYGPSETTIGVMYHRYQSGDSGVAKLSKVFRGTYTYVLNKRGKLCGYGEVGELYIAGAQLCDGYLGEAESRTFSILKEFNQRTYATGDLARYMPDNSIMILGRKDDQIKVRGFRIELGEVAACIEQVDGIEQCVVVADKIEGQVTLNAYIMSHNYAEGALNSETTSVLQAILAQCLPNAMVPSAFIAITQWPRLGNGKVDRKALPSFAMPIVAYDEPQGDLEIRLAAIFSEVLDIPQVSRSSSFFQLGGNSISAIKLVKRWADREPITLHFDLGGLFQAPSVAQLASVLICAESQEITRLNTHHAGNRQMICFHDGLGLTLSYRKIAQQLDGQINLFALLPNKEDLAVTDFDQLATKYAEKIITQFSGEKIELLGWSMGGLLAAKVAELLDKTAQQVTLLYLVDSWIPTAQLRTVTQLQAVTEFLALVVDSEDKTWLQIVDQYFTPLLGEAEVDAAVLNTHLHTFWHSISTRLTQPYNAIDAEQLTDTFATSEKLKALRDKGCTLPNLPAALNTYAFWSNERLTFDIAAYLSHLTINKAPLIELLLNCNHQQAVNHEQLLKVMKQ
jgi:amino acid adenylation domain-containing protein